MRRPSIVFLVLWCATGLLIAAGWWAGAAAPRSADARASGPGGAQQVPRDTLRGGRLDTVAPSGVGLGDTAAPIVVPEPTQAAVESLPALSEAGRRVRVARESLETPLFERVVSIAGIGVMVLLGWLISVNRGAFPWRIVLWGSALQIVFAILILQTAPGERFFAVVNDVVVKLLGYTQNGARFIFGNLVQNNLPIGTPAGEPAAMAPLRDTQPTQWAASGSYFAFTVLPTIIFFSSLMTVLYFLRVMQAAVKGVAWIMQRTMGTSGAETLSASGNIFLGQTEAPLMIRPFVEKMTVSELHCVMTGGFATVAGGVMAAYVGMLLPYFPDIAGHLLAASVMSAPAAIVISKVMYPEDGEPETMGTLKADVPSPDVNVIDAATRGAGDGLTLALNVGAMLLAFIALIALLNAGVGWVGGLFGYQNLSLELIFGWALAPLAWIMGVPWQDSVEVGSLLGVKTVINEFVAYLQLATMLQQGAPIEPRSVVIATYALCGFANFSSIAIQIGGIGGMAPSRRRDLSRIGLRAMIAGTLAAFMTATVAGAIL